MIESQKNWSDIARIIRVHQSNLTQKGNSTHLSVLDVMLVAGVLGVPCSELMPESYASFIECAARYLCRSNVQDCDLRAYAAYWAASPTNPRKEIDRISLSRAAVQSSLNEKETEKAIRRVANCLEVHLAHCREQIETMIVDGRLS